MARVEDISLGYDATPRRGAVGVVESQLRSLVEAAVEQGIGLPDLTRMMGDAVRSRLNGLAAEGHATPDEGLAALLRAEGGCVNVERARVLFRPPDGVTRQGLALQIRHGKVLAYRSGGGDYLVPVWQFRPEGGVWDRLPEVLAAIRDQLDATSPLTGFAFLLQAHPLTGGRPPLEALRGGRVEEVLAAVAADAR